MGFFPLVLLSSHIRVSVRILKTPLLAHLRTFVYWALKKSCAVKVCTVALAITFTFKCEVLFGRISNFIAMSC